MNDILAQGTQRMRAEAQETISLVRAAMGLPSYAHTKATPGVEPVRGLALV